MGNVFMDQKDYAKAVETYKEALRNNPDDDQTRYNYALAKELLEDQQQNPDNDQNQDQQNQDQQDQNQPQDEGEQEQEEPQGDGEDEQDQQGEQDQEGDQESDQEQDSEQQADSQPQEMPTKLSPQQIQNLLEAMNNEEKKVQDKVNAQKVKPSGKKKRKDW